MLRCTSKRCVGCFLAPIQKTLRCVAARVSVLRCIAERGTTERIAASFVSSPTLPRDVALLGGAARCGTAQCGAGWRDAVRCGVKRRSTPLPPPSAETEAEVEADDSPPAWWTPHNASCWRTGPAFPRSPGPLPPPAALGA